jgi:hypothetical protein
VRGFTTNARRGPRQPVGAADGRQTGQLRPWLLFGADMKAYDIVMRPYPIHVPLSVESVIALSAMLADSWTAFEVAGGNAQLACIDRVRITGGQTFAIQGVAVDVLPRLEAFTLAVSIVGPLSQNAADSIADRHRVIAEGAHFLERRHHLFIAGRRFPVPERANGVAKVTWLSRTRS